DVNFIAGDGVSLKFDPASNAVLLGSTPASTNGKGATPQTQNNDLDMNGHNIINVATIQSGTGSSTTGVIRFYNSGNGNYAGVQAASQSANRTYTIPDAGADATFVM